MGKDHHLLSCPSRPSCPSGLSIACLSCLVVAVTATTLFAQTHGDHAMPPLPRDVIERPLPLRMGIGVAHDAVSTRNPQAQAYYDQGLAYLHSYMWIEAARSFHQALRLDPGPGDRRRRPELRLCGAERAGRGPHSARSRAWARGGRERARSPSHRRCATLRWPPKTRLATSSGSTAYRKAIDDALAKWPDDVELWLLRGLAESTDAAERGQGSPPGSVRFFERAVTLAPKQFAAHHYLAHAFENAGRTSDALAQADAYARMAPQVPHARHMLGHELRRSGKIAEAIAEFEAADRLEGAYLDKEHVPAAHVWHYHHNLDLLATSYQYVGRVAKAEELFKKSFAIPSNSVEQEFNKREWPVFLLGRGRANEALAAAGEMASHPSPLVSAIGHVEEGEARLALKEPRAAAEEANAALRLMRSSPEGAGLVASALRQLQGELMLRARSAGPGPCGASTGGEGRPRRAGARRVGTSAVHARSHRARSP